MAIRDTLISLSTRALASARDVGATLLRAARPGEREPAPSYVPGMMAPWPNIDRYPTIIGANLTFPYISACQRQALYGYRLQWVDLLRELIRRDPSAYGNITARVLASAGGRIQVVSAAKRFAATELGEAERERVRVIRQQAGLASELPSMSEDECVLANQIAAHVQRQVDGLPRKPQTLAQQLWSIYYGPAGNELLWDRTPNEWRLRELHYIHPRRIAYPNQSNFHPHIWDQGLVAPTGPEWRDYLTQGLFGFDICDYPNKFLINVPEVVSGYPTEDGLGFILAWWIAAKLMGARSYMQFVERYAKPGTVATYNTKQNDGKPRDATPEDIALGEQVVQAMGYGGAPGALIPDSIKLELFGPAAMKGSSGTADPKTFVEWCDDQIARAIRTTDALQSLQRNGARSAMETLAKGANRVAFYDAMGLSSTWTRDVAAAITRLNYPTFERLCPAIVIHVDDEPGPEVLLERFKDLVSIGAPLDADKVAAALGVSDLLATKGDTEARILYQAKAIEALPPQKQTEDVEKNETVAPKDGATEENQAPQNANEEDEENET
jgi:hypothetical protein